MSRHSRLSAAIDNELAAEIAYVEASSHGDSSDQELTEWHKAYAARQAIKGPKWFGIPQRLLLLAVLIAAMFGLSSAAEGQQFVSPDNAETYNMAAFLCLFGMILVLHMILAVVISFVSLLVPGHAPPKLRPAAEPVTAPEPASPVWPWTDRRETRQRRQEDTLPAVRRPRRFSVTLTITRDQKDN